ncbi:hypothetical protein ACVWWO_000367 [Bradyrhizobium sp. F1.13.1]
MSAISTTIGNDTSAESHELPRTRLSLYYLVGYTLPVGVSLMFVPQTTMNLLLTNHAYDDLGLRMFGVLIFSLGIIAFGLIINKASRVYTVTLFVRGFIIAALFVLYSQYAGREPAGCCRSSKCRGPIREGSRVPAAY